MQADPIGNKDQMHLYGNVGNDAGSKSDSIGLSTLDPSMPEIAVSGTLESQDSCECEISVTTTR